MINVALTIVLFLISLLAILPAPAFYLWLLAIAVDEYPWIFVMISTVIIFINLKSKSFPILTALISVLSLLIFLSPIIRAFMISKNLKAQMTSSLGEINLENEKPFSITAMFNPGLAVAYKAISYKKNGAQALTLDFYPS